MLTQDQVLKQGGVSQPMTERCSCASDTYACVIDTLLMSIKVPLDSLYDDEKTYKLDEITLQRRGKWRDYLQLEPQLPVSETHAC